MGLPDADVRNGKMVRRGVDSTRWQIGGESEDEEFAGGRNSPMLYLQSRGERNTACRQPPGQLKARTEVWAHVEQLRQLSRSRSVLCWDGPP